MIERWITFGLAVVVACLSVALHIQTSRLEAVTTEYSNFRADVAAEGRAAERRKTAKEESDKKDKEKVDRELNATKRDLAQLYDAYRSLRDQRTNPRSGFVPSAPAGARDPDVATINRAELDRALRVLDSGVAGLLEEGDQGIAGLNAARRWAQNRKE